MRKVKLRGQEILEMSIPGDDKFLLLTDDKKGVKEITDGVYEERKKPKTPHDKDKYLWTGKKFHVKLAPAQRIAVESYYCGFLEYYDEETRNGYIEHDIYFEWKHDKISSEVKVYIIPEPIRIPITNPFLAKNNMVSEVIDPTATAAAVSSDPPPPKGPPPPPMR